jgi:hypothetical protein
MVPPGIEMGGPWSQRIIIFPALWG